MPERRAFNFRRRAGHYNISPGTYYFSGAGKRLRMVAAGVGSTPFVNTSLDKERTAFVAPRALKAPIFWKFSHLKNSVLPVLASMLADVITGVR